MRDDGKFYDAIRLLNGEIAANGATSRLRKLWLLAQPSNVSFRGNADTDWYHPRDDRLIVALIITHALHSLSFSQCFMARLLRPSESTFSPPALTDSDSPYFCDSRVSRHSASGLSVERSN